MHRHFNTLQPWLCKGMVKTYCNRQLITIYFSPLSLLPSLPAFYFCWQADLNTNIEDESRSFYGVSSQYESPENMVITCSTKVCSFGKQVVEKVEVGIRLLVCFAVTSSMHPAYIPCQRGGCHRLLFLRHAGRRLFQPATQPYPLH